MHYSQTKRKSCLAFDKSNRELISEVQGDIQVSVIFQHPLTIDEFKDLVQKSGMKVDTYSARAVDKANVRITIDGSPSIDKKDLVPQASFDKVLENGILSFFRGKTYVLQTKMHYLSNTVRQKL